MGINVFKRQKKEEQIKETENINLLTPKIFSKEEAERIFKYYFEKLHSAINSKDATNIAITGSYGSGKTTFIKNYQNVYDKERTGREYLNISLATFKEENNTPKDKENLERLIELSILQQILYHVEPSKIPNSNLKRIQSINPKFLLWFTILSTIWLYATTVLFKFNHISKINPNNWESNNPFDWITLVLILIFAGGIGYITHKGLRLLNSTKISKLKFLENELELGNKIDKSILNEHLDEIIYFFQRTSYDVIIFEDIDRFENTEIFTKLREINLLLNKSKQIERDLGKIIFVYAVRDDKFKDEERTKFFDYIIPIIPFINPTNASEQLWKLIKLEGLENTFTKHFIEDVIKLIDAIDMRLLTNIFNEFLMYKSKLLLNDDNKRRNDNLLAIIIYKNLHPKDFAELSQRKGDMFEILNKKNTYIKNKINEIETDIKTLNGNHKNIMNENIEVIKELRAIYINTIHKKIPDAISIIINNKEYNFIDLLEDDVFEEFQKQNKIQSKYYSRYYNGNEHYLESKISEVSFTDIEKEVNPRFTYEERVEFINNKTNGETTEIKREIEGLRNKIQQIESWDLTQIFQELNIAPDVSKFDNSRLIKYLLLEGYINENYNHYISLFHEENLTQEDYDFEIKVKTAENSPFNFELKSINNLISRLDIRYFERPAILNVHLLNYLLDHKQNEEGKLNRFFQQLSNENKRSIEFIDAYLDFEEKETPNIYDEEGGILQENNIKPFIQLLCKKWVRFWDYIYLESNYSEEKTKKYITYIVQYADIRDLMFFTNSSNINTYIMQQYTFLTFFEKVHHQKVREVITLLNIKFQELGYKTDETKKLYDFVYENNHYKINLPNISVLLDTYHKDETVSGLDGVLPENFQSNNYETILESGCIHLIDYIDKNIEEYVKKAYLKTDLDNTERESILTKYFLNNDSLSLDLKIKIIEKTKTIFSDISEVQNVELKKKLIQTNKIKPTWHNIYSYLNDFENTFIDDTLITFYNEEENYKSLSLEILNTDVKNLHLFYRKMARAMLKCDDLSIESYSKLTSSINSHYTNLSFEHLQIDKVRVLVEKSILSLKEDNYNKLRENFPNEHISLLEKHQNNFIKDISSFTLDEEDLTILLQSTNFQTSNKIKLLKNITEENLSNSQELSKAVIDIVLKDNNLSLNFEKIRTILSHKISTELKIRLLVLYKSISSKERYIELVSLLPYSYSKIASSSQTTIPKSETNKQFIKALQEKGIVSDKVRENKLNEFGLYMKKF